MKTLVILGIIGFFGSILIITAILSRNERRQMSRLIDPKKDVKELEKSLRQKK